MKSIKRIFAIFWRQMILLKVSPIRPINTFYWVAVDLFLWGVLTRYLDSAGISGFHPVPVLMGAVILYNFLTRVIFGISISFLEDVWTRNLINLFSSPLRLHEYMLGFVAVVLVQSGLSLVFMALLARFFLAYSIVSFGLPLIAFVGVLFIFGIAMGIFTTAVMVRFGPSAEMFSWSFPAILAPMSAVFYPLSALPPFLRAIGFFIPATHVFEGMRTLVRTGAVSGRELAIGFVLALVYCAAAYFFLHRSYQSVLRRGTFGRFATD
jgi:ABC-2 type transport system permease protein